MKRIERLSRLLLAATLVGLAASCAMADEWTYDDAGRVVAISDPHGDFDAMVQTLQQAGVIDDQRNWLGVNTRLVITGDLLDRGPESRKIMDLVMQLEGQAAESAGQVHLLLGNHEVMNLIGDLRYVAPAEYAAFASDESAEEREAWFERLLAAQGEDADELQVRATFDKMAPPGFFAHRKAFRPDGKYGSWLLQKPMIVVIDGTAFVHGGLSPRVAEWGLAGVNGGLGGELQRYAEALVVLEDGGALMPWDNYYEHDKILQAQMEAMTLPAALAAAANTIIELADSEFNGLDGPLWFRGNVACGALSGGDNLDAALQKIGAQRVVIGHTPTLTRRVLQRLDGRVVEIDTGMLNAYYKGSGNALQIENGVLTVINEDGTSNSPPIDHPRFVGDRDETVTADQLALFLETATVEAIQDDEFDRTIVGLSNELMRGSAYFEPKPRRKEFYADVAAYRLDRLLNLDRVPVTVIREIDGDAGSLQYIPPATRNEVERAASGRGGTAWCPIGDQWNSAYVFDALIYNVRRSEYMLYDPSSWQLMLVSHGNAFSTKKSRPPHLKSVPLRLNNAWVKALQDLTDEVLNESLSDVLDPRQIKALATRRDGLLKDAAR